MTDVWWPFQREPQTEEASVHPDTEALADRTERLADRVDRLAVETKAVRREAEDVRARNHFGPALAAVFMTPRKR